MANRLLVSLLIMGLLSACSLTDSLSEPQVAPVFSGAPTVQIASPLAQEVYLQGASVNILARIENAGADIARLEILVNDVVIGTAPQPNAVGAGAFTLTNSWTALEAGDKVITVRATRGDGTTEGLSTVQISVLSTNTPETTPEAALTEATPAIPAVTEVTPEASTATAQVVATTAPQAEPTATATVATQEALAPTASVPQVRVLQGANVRSGPGLIFNPPIGNLAAETVANAVGVSPDRQWYKIQFGAATGWISAQVVEAVGNIASLPIDAGPPPPAPTATPAPTNTPVPAANVDLSVVLITTNPNPPVCLQPFTVVARVVNTGTAASVETAVTFVDTYNGADGTTASALVRALAPNESADVSVTLNVSNNFSETHIIRVTADSDGRIVESNETNNSNTLTYILSQGGC